jgi:hypothetical protein
VEEHKGGRWLQSPSRCEYCAELFGGGGCSGWMCRKQAQGAAMMEGREGAWLWS